MSLTSHVEVVPSRNQVLQVFEVGFCEPGSCTNGERNREARTVRRNRLVDGVAAMKAGDAADYGEAEPSAAGLRRARRVHSVEPLEDARGVLWRDADSVVLDRESRLLRVRRAQDLDLLRAGMPERVLDEIGKRLGDELSVAQHRQRLGDDGAERRAVLLGDFLRKAHDVGFLAAQDVPFPL